MRYIAAKVDALQNFATKPVKGEHITVDVSVNLTNGKDAFMKVEMPWNLEPNGQVDIRSWWLAQSNFAKGSAFNP